LGIRENRMYLIMADTVQAYGYLATLALRYEMVSVFLIIGDHSPAHRAKHWLWLHIRGSDVVSVFAGHLSSVDHVRLLAARLDRLYQSGPLPQYRFC
jgi:hypothetical protein